MILPLFLSDWNLNSPGVSPDLIDREREFDNPLGMLIYPDLQDISPISWSLSAICAVGSWFGKKEKKNLTIAWAYNNSFLGIRDKIFLRKFALATFVFTLVPVIPFATVTVVETALERPLEW